MNLTKSAPQADSRGPCRLSGGGQSEMTQPKRWKVVVKHLATLPREVQHYFEHIRKLARDVPWEVSLAYVFSRVEIAHNMAIYWGAVNALCYHIGHVWENSERIRSF